MVYKITVDGKRRYAEIPIYKYSQEAENLARERIIDYCINNEGAKEVYINTPPEETKKLHEIADEFYKQAKEFHDIYMNLPYDKAWGAEEMELLIPQLMKIYVLAMKLPNLEWLEDNEYSDKVEIKYRKMNFSEEYDKYWQIYVPYPHLSSERYQKIAYTPNTGWLSDDIRDIMMDISRGMEAYLCGLVCKAIFYWEFSLYTHYGKHITDALSAMCWAWEKNKSKIEDEKFDNYIYWGEKYEDGIIIPDPAKLKLD